METWKDIPEYEGLYQVSNMGNVKSLEKIRYCGKKLQRQVYRERHLIKCKITSGYLVVGLFKDGVKATMPVHRLVAMAFVEGDRKEQVNHINAIKTDNRSENLEWCTRSENMLHAVRMGLGQYDKQRSA